MATTHLDSESWREFQVALSAEASEALADYLEEQLGQPPSVYLDRECGDGRVSAYIDESVDAERLRQDTLERIEWLRTCGLDVGEPNIQALPVAKEDWAESWKRHFPILEIGARVRLVPSWLADEAAPSDRIDVILDPGFSFGTGHHATTAFCLERLQDPWPEGSTTRSLLDVGTGSGLLAIAGAALGYDRIEAFDYDPDSVRSARENAARNPGATRVRFFQEDVREVAIDQPFDDVCANLVTPVILENAQRLVRWVAPGGRLIVAGILVEQFESVIAAMAGLGWRLDLAKSEKEWRSGAFSQVKA